VSVRPLGDGAPLVVRSGDRLVLDVVQPILGGQLGHVRLGLDMSPLDEARGTLAVRLGILALVVIAAGLIAAYFAGRSVARPIDDILAAADRFDPAAGSREADVRTRGSDEIAVLADRFNRMMRRLEEAHAEQVRGRQRAVATERLAAMGALVAGVAHEVNNPLAGLKNCVRRLERDDLPEPKRREYLALMEEGLVRIEEVVRQLLDFGRPHPPRLEPVAASRLAHETMTLLRPKLDRRRVRLELLGGDAVALADRRLVEQALVNLLLNASYVTPDGGEIRARIRRRDGLVGISVEDDGPGIPQEIRDRILDPFFSTKPEGQGTGLGLSVTRTIVDQHGGELSFEFPPAGGTVATVWLRSGEPASGAASA
jgi:two-component system NtrC family sensor kinase